jgi:hypothetical protein
LTAVRGVAGFTAPDMPDAAPGAAGSGDTTDPDFRLPAGGFAALLSGHTGQ